MKLVEQFYKIIAPSDCLACGEEGSLLCKWCIDDAIVQHDSRCYRCNRLAKNFAVCPACRRKSSLKNVFIRTEYIGLPKELVHRMKFNYSNEAADIIAEELINILPALPPETIIVNVPTITSHVRQRGFDHTKRIAGNLSQTLGLEFSPVLRRTNQEHQVGSGRKSRLTQQKDAFRIRNNKTIKNKHVLLIDDVITTGATLESAARLLKESGAKNVYGVVFVRSTL